MAVSWDSNVNQKVLRSGTGWEEPVTIIEDKTRSGKVKRRFAHSCENRTFSVAFNFTLDEYDDFRTWFETTTRCGMYSFYFPQIDGIDKTVLKEYRITKNGFPKYSNESGKIIKCSMTWEEL